jgi:hypothetical protein
LNEYGTLAAHVEQAHAPAGKPASSDNVRFPVSDDTIAKAAGAQST